MSRFAHDIWHVVGGEHSLKISAPQPLGLGINDVLKIRRKSMTYSLKGLAFYEISCDYWSPWHSWEVLDFVKISDILISSSRTPNRRKIFFLLTVFNGLFHLENFSQKFDITNLIYVINHVKKTLYGIALSKVLKFFKTKRESRNTGKNSKKKLKVLSWRYQDFQHLYKIQTFLGTSWSSIIKIGLIKFSRL